MAGDRESDGAVSGQDEAAQGDPSRGVCRGPSRGGAALSAIAPRAGLGRAGIGGMAGAGGAVRLLRSRRGAPFPGERPTGGSTPGRAPTPVSRGARVGPLGAGAGPCVGADWRRIAAVIRGPMAARAENCRVG